VIVSLIIVFHTLVIKMILLFSLRCFPHGGMTD